MKYQVYLYQYTFILRAPCRLHVPTINPFTITYAVHKPKWTVIPSFIMGSTKTMKIHIQFVVSVAYTGILSVPLCVRVHVTALTGNGNFVKLAQTKISLSQKLQPPALSVENHRTLSMSYMYAVYIYVCTWVNKKCEICFIITAWCYNSQVTQL